MERVVRKGNVATTANSGLGKCMSLKPSERYFESSAWSGVASAPYARMELTANLSWLSGTVSGSS